MGLPAWVKETPVHASFMTPFRKDWVKKQDKYTNKENRKLIKPGFCYTHTP
jgi:hypothetical protein